MVQSLPISFLDLEFEQVDISQTRDWVVQHSKLETFTYLVTPNVDHVVQIHGAGNGAAAQAYRDADFVVCDSRILSLLARVSGFRLPVVPGSDLTRELIASLPEGTRLAVVGGDEAQSASLAHQYPRYEWTFHYPPLGVRSNLAARQAIAAFVCESRADIILFAIGAPQSEITCREIAMLGGARGTALCIGASLEFLTGAKRRAPRWMQKLALEWLFRLLSEPRRLWRRYLVVGPRVLLIWWRWRSSSSARQVDACASMLSDVSETDRGKSEPSRPRKSGPEPML
jgi:N-acetylglucosaminyldiphosphoundecaprenol N-acetyl-beta-D-mannosaminyltransferase